MPNTMPMPEMPPAESTMVLDGVMTPKNLSPIFLAGEHSVKTAQSSKAVDDEQAPRPAFLSQKSLGIRTPVSGCNTPIARFSTVTCDCHLKVRVGLEGVIVCETKVSTVGIPNIGLTYRGYPITQLINGSTFEEVAYLLIAGERPKASVLREFKNKIAQGRNLSLQSKAFAELYPANAVPMDVIRTGVSFYATQAHDLTDVTDMAASLIGFLPSLVTYWYNFAKNGKRIDTVAGAELGVAAHFLQCLNQKEPSPLSANSLDKTLIGYGEHDLNASTFSCRVTASTLGDYHSCITAAIGTLKGPLHGGANEAALELLSKFDEPDQVNQTLTDMLARKEKIMGFGHRIYKTGDPRHFIMKELARGLSQSEESVDADPKLFRIAEELEQEMIARKRIYPNLDFFAAVVYKQLGIPKDLFTVLFSMGRIAGWSAHFLEQNEQNKLIRPNSSYVGEEVRTWNTNFLI